MVYIASNTKRSSDINTNINAIDLLNLIGDKVEDVKVLVTDIRDKLESLHDTARELTEVMGCISKTSNQKLYSLAIFLQRYNDKNQKEKYILDDYLRLLGNIKSDYKQKVKQLHENQKEHEIFNRIDDSGKHILMLHCVQSLSQSQQTQLVRVAWFVLYCELEGIDNNNQTSSFQDFYFLLQKIDEL